MQDLIPPGAGAASGFERTTLRQFNIFLENRVGRLTALLCVLEKAGQCVNAISIEDSADAALVRLICAHPTDARRCLNEAGFSFSESDVIAVTLPRKEPHPLVRVTRALLSAELNIHYAYPMLKCAKGPAIILYVDDRTLAVQILLRKGFDIVGETDLAPMPD